MVCQPGGRTLSQLPGPALTPGHGGQPQPQAAPDEDDGAGEIAGEHLYVGLYATHVYHISTNDIPVVRSKVAAVRAACAFAPGGYRDKALVHALETYPREELLEIGEADVKKLMADFDMEDPAPGRPLRKPRER